MYTSGHYSQESEDYITNKKLMNTTGLVNEKSTWNPCFNHQLWGVPVKNRYVHHQQIFRTPPAAAGTVSFGNWEEHQNDCRYGRTKTIRQPVDYALPELLRPTNIRLCACVVIDKLDKPTMCQTIGLHNWKIVPLGCCNHISCWSSQSRSLKASPNPSFACRTVAPWAKIDANPPAVVVQRNGRWLVMVDKCW